eukprot:9495697-Pyramimonas_sp.AAC.1
MVDSLKGRAAARDWVLSRMRLARSPRITMKHCLRMAIEYLVPRRLRTTTIANASCSALHDWSKASFVERENHSMLEIPFLLPDSAHERIRRGGWDKHSRATDVRKLHALLNAGVFPPSRERWGMGVRTDQKAKTKIFAEG